MRQRRTATRGRLHARLEWRSKDHSLIHVDDYSASFKDERFDNLSDAEREERLTGMSYFQRGLMRARAAERKVDEEEVKDVEE